MPRDLHSLRTIAQLEPAAQLVAAEVLAMLEHADGPPAHGLAQTLAIACRGDGAATERLAALSAQRVATLWDQEREAAWTWLQAWFRSDAEAAWRFVEAALTAAPQEARTVLVRLLHLWDGDLTDADRGGGPYLRNLPLLAKVVPTVFRHLPPSDDPQHDGVYEVTDEDRAVTMRGRLARILEQIDGPEAHAVLKDLTTHRDIGEAQQFFRDAVQRHAERAAEFLAWTPDQLVAFAAAHERDPVNADQLYQVTCDRLAAIREDMEEGDFGDRGIFPQGTPEITLQRYFAGRLKRESRGRYTVTREEEVADHKMPDIRIRHTTAGVVSIEIKPLDDGRYTLPQLMSTLEDQLVGQYMRTVGSHHGILLLCLLKKRTWRLTNPTEVIDFPELVRRLNRFAASLMAQRPDIKGLTVVGIDATDWEKDSAKAPKATRAAKGKADTGQAAPKADRKKAKVSP